MAAMWKSIEDAVRDLTLMDDFGGTNVGQIKSDLTKETSYCTEETPHRFVDPWTGEEIDIQGECKLSDFDGRDKAVAVGRGKLIEEFKHASKVKKLQKQLRMKRPLGFGNNMIESYFVNLNETEEPFPTTSKEGDAPKNVTGKRRNVLISSLLERMESGDRILEDSLVVDVKPSNSDVRTCDNSENDEECVVDACCRTNNDDNMDSFIHKMSESQF